MIQDEKGLPTIKFYKDAVQDILDGRKTLEPRPRSHAWISRIEAAGRAHLTYGPRAGKPTIFATARIVGVELRGFETATADDLRLIGYDWPNRTVEEFVAVYTDWFAKELARGYPVAWIKFEVERP